MRQIIVTKDASAALGALGFPVETILTVLQKVREELAENSDRHRSDRDPRDPDTLFRVKYSLMVDGRWRLFVFSVCDTISPDHFFVEGVVTT